MPIEVKIPEVGESVQEAVLAEWFKQDGDRVAKDEALLVIETDKVTLEVTAEVGGVLRIQVQAGETVAIGAVVAVIEPSDQAAAQETSGKKPAEAAVEKPSAKKAASEEKKPAPEGPSKPAEEQKKPKAEEPGAAADVAEAPDSKGPPTCLPCQEGGSIAQ